MKNKWYQVPRCVFANALYRSAKAPVKQQIDSDVDRYLAERGTGQDANRVAALDCLLLSGDLASDAVYVGNPARFIKNIGENDKLLEEIM